MGQRTQASKLAHATEGVGPSVLFSMLWPPSKLHPQAAGWGATFLIWSWCNSVAQEVRHLQKDGFSFSTMNDMEASADSWSWCVPQMEVSGAAGLQATMAIVTDKGKSSKEQGNLVVKEAMAAMMHHWQAPFRYGPREEQCSPLHSTCPFCQTLTCNMSSAGRTFALRQSCLWLAASALSSSRS